MKTKLWPASLILLSLASFAQPQNGPALSSPNFDESSDYQNPLPNEGNGTSTWSDRQAQEERDFNKNRDLQDEYRDSEYEEDDEVELDE